MERKGEKEGGRPAEGLCLLSQQEPCSTSTSPVRHALAAATTTHSLAATQHYGGIAHQGSAVIPKSIPERQIQLHSTTSILLPIISDPACNTIMQHRQSKTDRQPTNVLTLKPTTFLPCHSPFLLPSLLFPPPFLPSFHHLPPSLFPYPPSPPFLVGSPGPTLPFRHHAYTRRPPSWGSLPGVDLITIMNAAARNQPSFRTSFYKSSALFPSRIFFSSSLSLLPFPRRVPSC